jgi:hypothetical protein
MIEMRIKICTIIQGGTILIMTKMALFKAILCIVRVGTRGMRIKIGTIIQGETISITIKIALFQAIVCIVRVGTHGSTVAVLTFISYVTPMYCM